MNSHITIAGEPVSRHLALESRDFPTDSPENGRVWCSKCPMHFDYNDGPPAGWEYVEAAGIGLYNCPAHLFAPPAVEHRSECPRATNPDATLVRLDCPACYPGYNKHREWKLGDRVRTSFDGEAFPGVYEIVGFGQKGAHLQSDRYARTWCPLEELLPAEDAPLGRLTPRQEVKVLEFAKLIAKMLPETAQSALTLLDRMICRRCGTPRGKNNTPNCDCPKEAPCPRSDTPTTP